MDKLEDEPKTLSLAVKSLSFATEKLGIVLWPLTAKSLNVVTAKAEAGIMTDEAREGNEGMVGVFLSLLATIVEGKVRTEEHDWVDDVRCNVMMGLSWGH